MLQKLGAQKYSRHRVGQIANELTENAKENKIYRQRKLPRKINSTERLLSSYFPHFLTILITLLLLSSALPDMFKAEQAIVFPS